MKSKKAVRTALLLLSPLLLFLLLAGPYLWVNSNRIVNWLGCGCEPSFNANDFTACFWLAVSAAVGLISALLSGKLLPKWWHRAAYVACMAAASLLISRVLCQWMMWN